MKKQGGGKEHDLSGFRDVLPPPVDWAQDPLPALEQKMAEKEFPFQKTLRVGTQLIRVVQHRERNIFEDEHTEDGVKTHSVVQAEIHVVFKRPNSNPNRVWVSLKQALILKNYAMVHAYLQQHEELQTTTSKLFKHGIAVFHGKPHGAYVVSHDRDDLHTPFGVAFEDGDSGDYPSMTVQRLIDNPQLDMSSDIQGELHQLPVCRIKNRVHRVLVLCSGTNHDAIGL
mmetsp:Transcript_28149/g.69319  ORF Transcript_28149/g.69319 Transcript_28149/m.69319 type:complete len:227 (-) Transcript_28149:699-1379(-)